MPIGLAHDGANRHDSKLLAPTLDSIPITRPEPSVKRPQGLCLDRGHDYPWVRELAADYRLVPHIRGRADESATGSRRPAGAHAAGSSRPATPGSTETAPF